MAKLRTRSLQSLALVPALGDAMYLICIVHCALPH